MSCVDLMYQFYSPYFSYKSPADDTSTQKFSSSQPLYDATGITGTATATAAAATANNFLENPHLPPPPPHHGSNTNSHHQHQHHHHQHHSDNDKESRDSTEKSSSSSSSSQQQQNQQQQQQQQQPSQSNHHQQQQQHPQQHPHHQPQPRTTHYLTANCVLFTYFSGETGTVVDDHFSRALSQPSSFTLDKPPPNSKSYSRSESLLMCHRKLPPSFWNSSYQPPPCTNSASGGNNFAAFGADAYFQSSLYNFHKTWPYHYSHHTQSHAYPHHQGAAHGLPYPSMDSTGRLSSHYGSFMMPGPSLSSRVPSDSRAHSQYDFSKTTDAFTNYYGMGRFGSDVEAALPGWS